MVKVGDKVRYIKTYPYGNLDKIQTVTKLDPNNRGVYTDFRSDLEGWIHRDWLELVEKNKEVYSIW